MTNVTTNYTTRIKVKSDESTQEAYTPSDGEEESQSNPQVSG
ncbi:hypothetical protein ACFSGI_08840 [Paenibacillus nicotianae]|uniref:Uncharacterized protein n=1 Tax=Paenibacillus nicotianae TaxID=1526551 RepID=A0ABW4UVB7_9BACL